MDGVLSSTGDILLETKINVYRECVTLFMDFLDPKFQAITPKKQVALGRRMANIDDNA